MIELLIPLAITAVFAALVVGLDRIEAWWNHRCFMHRYWEARLAAHEPPKQLLLAPEDERPTVPDIRVRS